MLWFMRIQFWNSGGQWSTPTLPLLADPLWPGVVVPIRVQSMGQINLFENYLYLIGILETINMCKLFVLRIVT